jgi:flagellar biosynthesis protein FliR
VATYLIAHLVAVCLASLRLGPVLAFAPPFSLVAMPAPARVVIVAGLSAAMPLSDPELRMMLSRQAVMTGAFHELAMGLMLALALQFAFAMIAMAGRALDIQVGFGLASVVDPATKAQMPLIETILTYAAAAVFFTTNGPRDLFAVLIASFVRYPIMGPLAPIAPGGLMEFIGVAGMLSLALVGVALLVLFLIDLSIALLSRTLPQMNVLVLGFQAKSLAALVLLPMVVGTSGAVIARLMWLAVQNTMPAH